MDIKGLDKAEVLAALYNASKPQGMGFLHYKPQDMTRDEAQRILDGLGKDPYIDYLQGRVMKIGLGGDELRTNLYNRDNGPGAAERVIEELIEKATKP